MKSLILAVIVIATIMVSCSDNRSGNRVTPKLELESSLVRTKILKDNTISYCYLTDAQRLILRATDTVWFNPVTHHIVDSFIPSTVKAVLYK